MIWRYENECKKEGMEEEKINDLRKVFDLEKKRIKRETAALEKNHIEYSLLSELEDNGFRKAVLVEDRTVNIEEEAIRAYEISLLKDSLRNLTVEEKQLVVWHYYDEMSLRMIAKKIGITLSAVENRHKRIIEKLRKEMGGGNR